MRVLYAAPEEAWGGLFHALSAELPEHQLEPGGQIGIETLRGYEVVIPTMSPVTRSLLKDSDRLRLIQQCGAGLELVDVVAARDHRIWVANVPTQVSGAADAVAELGVFFLLALSRNLHGMASSIADGRVGQPRGRALRGSTVGIVGLGGIGRALVGRLRGFGVHLIGLKLTDPWRAMEELRLDWVGGPNQLQELLSRADHVVLCLPSTAQTRGLFDRHAFAAMKRGAFLINLARADLIERSALIEALASGKIGGAGLDVLWEEPPDPADPLLSFNVLATPHVAAFTDFSNRGLVSAMANNIRRVANHLMPLYCL